MLLLLIWISLVYEINWHATVDDNLAGEERCLSNEHLFTEFRKLA